MPDGRSTARLGARLQVPLRVPSVEVFHSVDVEIVDGLDLFVERGAAVNVELPDEFHLRELLSVDLASTEALHDFVVRWGVPRPRRPDEDEPWAREMFTARQLKRDRWYRSERAVVDRGRSVVAAERMAWNLALLRGFTRMAMSRLPGGADPSLLSVSQDELGFGLAPDLVDRFLVAGVNAGLGRGFSPGLQLVDTRPGADGIDIASESADLLGDGPIRYGPIGRVNVWDAVCALINNMVLDQSQMRRCPECDGWFSKQLGRARAGQHRTTGVTYCTRQCAGRVAQRASRRRKRMGTV